MLRLAVEDEEADGLVNLLKQFSSVKTVARGDDSHAETKSPYERLVQIQESICGKKLFEDIADPVEWQREIRKEWDRGF